MVSLHYFSVLFFSMRARNLSLSLAFDLSSDFVLPHHKTMQSGAFSLACIFCFVAKRCYYW